MARIKIEDLPVLEELSEKEVKGIFGGGVTEGDATGEQSLVRDEKVTAEDPTKGDGEEHPLPDEWHPLPDQW